MPRLSRPLADMDARYDVVVIGSGYGGGVAASRLARAGKRVCVLERGREIMTGEFPARFPQMAKEMQVSTAKLRTGSATALYDVRLGEDMHVLVGCGLGGGSLINAGVALRPDQRVFEDRVWPDELRDDGLLDEGFSRAHRWLRPAVHQGARAMTKFRALEKSGAALGVAPVVPPVVVSFTPNKNPAGVEQPGCTLCGDCCGGCNVGAKNTVALTYLPDAAANGAHIFTHAKARHVTRAGTGWRVAFEVTGADHQDGDGAARSLEAEIVILSAGTLGSTEILLRSRAQGLAVSSRLGERFSANGDIIAFGYGAKERVNAIGVGHPARVAGEPVGACVSGQIELHDAAVLDNEICIQEGVMPSALAPMLPALFVPGGRLLGALESLIKGVYKGPFAHLQTFFAVSHDTASGRMTLDHGKLALSWPGAADEPVFKRLDAALAQAVAGVGGAYIKSPLAKTSVGSKPATAHPLGGAGMGEDAATGVVNHKGQLFDAGAGASPTAVHRGLYVVDGSVIPRSLGVNPLLTITALAERTLIHLARDHNLSFDDAPRDANGYGENLIPHPAASGGLA